MKASEGQKPIVGPVLGVWSPTYNSSTCEQASGVLTWLCPFSFQMTLPHTSLHWIYHVTCGEDPPMLQFSLYFIEKMKTFPHFQVWHCFFWSWKPSHGKAVMKIRYPSLPKAEGVARNIQLCRLGQLRRKFTVRVTFPAQKDKWHRRSWDGRKSSLSALITWNGLLMAAFLHLLFGSTDFLRPHHGRQPLAPYTRLLSSTFTIVI